ncbi:dihydrofolate reductase [Clostridium tagluense]|uniref:dihydrofolate reductase n=1 Tax=Clostridium tagluense TaxID=360422 RepID=UPI001CF4F66B|nr:dihydrofolate reductase [Clostridium tagluense]MCB2314085.1 dihydrofolate reductase [Clostridium tagluense]MCB2318922.1 dihydrofolate reductase [Clostridium tagluense]MCB2323833.1 dihydrofolate reductase [Clostridium tagluense]MCB2328643.1 dihydrofolate reductase [Clostridium tagluense]MCB2333527.1 dihydrofolate reductase [Clostridium tagluense]
MNLIAAVDLNWGIGYNTKLLVKIPEDMKYFKEKTIGKVIVMGRNTLESLPDKKPLEQRVNIVLTKNRSYNCEGVILCYSLEELFKELKKYNEKDVFIIGGQSIYAQLMPHCDKAYITKIYKEYVHNKVLANLDNNNQWQKISTSEKQQFKEDIYYTFNTYIKK